MKKKIKKPVDLDACYAEAAKFDAKQYDKWVSKNFEIFCKRTDYPKLGYIISRLNTLGIPCLLHSASFHAEHILWIPNDDALRDKAWNVLAERRVAWPGKRLDDMPDDHRYFLSYANVKPEPLVDITGDPSWDRTVQGDR